MWQALRASGPERQLRAAISQLYGIHEAAVLSHVPDG